MNALETLETNEFWSAAGERAVKTFAQTLLAVWGAGAVSPMDIDWKAALLTAVFAAVASVLTSIASSGGGNPGPSLASETIKLPPGRHAGGDPV